MFSSGFFLDLSVILRENLKIFVNTDLILLSLIRRGGPEYCDPFCIQIMIQIFPKMKPLLPLARSCQYKQIMKNHLFLLEYKVNAIETTLGMGP